MHVEPFRELSLGACREVRPRGDPARLLPGHLGELPQPGQRPLLERDGDRRLGRLLQHGRTPRSGRSSDAYRLVSCLLPPAFPGRFIQQARSGHVGDDLALDGVPDQRPDQRAEGLLVRNVPAVPPGAEAVSVDHPFLASGRTDSGTDLAGGEPGAVYQLTEACGEVRPGVVAHPIILHPDRKTHSGPLKW